MEIPYMDYIQGNKKWWSGEGRLKAESALGGPGSNEANVNEEFHC